MDAQALIARHLPAQRAFYRLFHGASPGATVVERDDGLTVATCPARPERSLVNAVLYERPGPLVAALPELDAHFAEAGIRAWTVWVHPGDATAAAACADAGHVLDATPELMWAPLDDGFALDHDAAALDLAPDWTTVGDVNDAAYGLPPAHLAVTLAGADPGAPGALRALATAEDGRPLACAVTVLAGDVAEVAMVATIPEARGRGLAGACMRAGLAWARDQGATITTLEATKMGEPLYARMGYRAAGALGMWERRSPSEIVG